ncbi:MAG: PAS domain S-box protein [Pirellulales bacterium]|nr:PAS domain S-box protein [Pirellulales bacterium]
MNLLRQSPIYLFLQVLAIVFVAEVGVMFVLPMLLPREVPEAVRAVADSCLLTLLSAPLLWWAIIGPLRRLAATEQAKAEALGAAAPEGIITFNARGVVESFNPAAEEIFGLSAAEIVGGDLGTLIPWQFLARYRNGSADDAGQPRLLEGTVKIPGRRKDGSEVPLALSVSEVPLSGRLLYMAVVRDLVDRERDEMRAEQMAAVAQLGTALAHRLRNPLTSIKMLVQAGNRRRESLELDQEDLRVIEDEVRRMERSLQTFLDFARPRKPVCRDLDFASLVAESIAEVQPRARQRNVAIRLTGRADSTALCGDSDQLRELVLHLLHNAVDASPQTGTVEIELRSMGVGELELRVLDSGAGIAPEVSSRLFQPFVTTKTTGVGLGMAISRRIAEGHGGSLSAANRPEGGACFTLRLPADQCARAQVDKAADWD